MLCYNFQISESSPTSPEEGDSEEEPRRSRSSQSCPNLKCPNIPIFKRRNRPSKKGCVPPMYMMKYLREELEGGMDDNLSDSDVVRKAKKQLR